MVNGIFKCLISNCVRIYVCVCVYKMPIYITYAHTNSYAELYDGQIISNSFFNIDIENVEKLTHIIEKWTFVR